MLYFLYKIGIFLANVLPARIGYKIADFLASVYYLLCKKDREVVEGNLKVVLNHTHNSADIRSVSRMVFINFARYLIEFFRAPKIDLQFIQQHVMIEYKDNLDKALQLGRGVVAVSAHLGNWEVGGMVLSMLGYRVNEVAWTHKNSRINEYFLAQRQSKGLNVIPLGLALRKIFSALKKNEIVAFLGDVDFINPNIGVPIKFFGLETMMPKGPASFSLKTGAPVVTAFLLREDIHRFKFVIDEPIIYTPQGDYESDLVHLTAEISKRIESYIALYPGQWFMLRPRWETTD